MGFGVQRRPVPDLCCHFLNNARKANSKAISLSLSQLGFLAEERRSRSWSEMLRHREALQRRSRIRRLILKLIALSRMVLHGVGHHYGFAQREGDKARGPCIYIRYLSSPNRKYAKVSSNYMSPRYPISRSVPSSCCYAWEPGPLIASHVPMGYEEAANSIGLSICAMFYT